MNYKYTFFIIIYLFLNSCKNESNLKNIQNNESQEKKIKTEKELFAAFGWLAKENKIALEEEGANLLVSLI